MDLGGEVGEDLGGDRNCNQKMSYKKSSFKNKKKDKELFAVLKPDILNAPRGCYVELQKSCVSVQLVRLCQ